MEDDEKKYLVFFMLLVAVIFLLVGCSQAPADETNGDAEENEQENGAANAENEGSLTAVVQGKVTNALEFKWGDFSDKEVTVKAAKKKCEGTEPAREYTGIPLSVILEATQPEAGTTKLIVEADDGYQKNFVLEDVLADDTIIITEQDGKLQIIPAPEKYDAKSWVSGVVKLTVD